MRSLLACLFGLAASTVLAAEYPTTGMLYNQQEDSSLTYTCTLQQGQQRLRCEFIQTAVRKKSKPADLEEKLAEARKNYPGAVKEFSDPRECNMVGAWLGMATGQISIDAALARNPGIATDAAKFKEGMIRLQEDAKANPSVLDTFRALAGMCDHPTEENFLKITKADHDKNLRTCQVSSNPFAQEFVWVSDFGNGGAWVVSSHPEGACGVVQLSRFEKDQSDTSGLFWRYIARKAATNPSGKVLPGLSCSAVDQREYVYDWKKTRSDYLQCEYVEFSPI
ncbi:hypothetical protein [Rhizobium sp. R693]|uniref:hypothetical protein n=1 Tax=Rhizobium sp. R693 TaxID=1764276 RepID=UPI000B65852E|nr:hypothetical protein [Rhizobium sp. R693]OWV99537.1 hypothetical protein ATY79_17435 [Rhizobium sp. R693]